jgi:hypothetical protein
MGCEKRGFEVAKQAIERPGQRLPPRDQNIVIAGQPIKGKKRRRHSFQPASCPVPRHCIADLAAGRESDTNGPRSGGCACRCRANFHRHACRDAAGTFRHSQEILAVFEAGDRLGASQDRVFGVGQADSLLRPWARRRDSTLRPPAVAMRALKPWRRLRTILLG